MRTHYQNQPTRFGAAATIFVAVAAVAAGVMSGRSARADASDPSLIVTADPTGQLRTLNGNGEIDLTNPFFQVLGTNGRTCNSCHQADQGWTISPSVVRQRFVASNGLDPLFRNNDGSNCENADISTSAKRRLAFSLLLNRGLIRVGIDVPPGAEFTIESVDDPYNCGAPTTGASMYRRPLPATNLGFLSAVMWDGRESSPTTTILTDLAHQADDATTGHAQASLHLTTQEASEIVAFETGLFTAQARDDQAGTLSAEGAYGGPVALSRQPFFIGINDPVGLNPAGTTFDQSAFTLFASWAHLNHDEQNQGNHDERDAARQSIARGEVLFNTKPITISGVAGLNDQTFASGVTVPSSFTGNCTICHDTPNVGNHSVKAPLNIGLTDPSRRTPDMPLYTLRNIATGQTVQTTDPGRAMITGKWADVGKFKGPILRGLAARAPYFHNGSAATLEDVLDFYDTRFNIGFTAQEKADLIAFLNAL
jgi:cytochrome c peroxidase